MVEHRNIRKRVDDIMSGYIARTKADEILEQGIEQGIEKGIEKGVDIGGDEVASALYYLYMNNREDEAREAMRDKTVRTRILEEYRLRESSKNVEQFSEISET